MIDRRGEGTYRRVHRLINSKYGGREGEGGSRFHRRNRRAQRAIAAELFRDCVTVNVPRAIRPINGGGVHYHCVIYSQLRLANHWPLPYLGR